MSSNLPWFCPLFQVYCVSCHFALIFSTFVGWSFSSVLFILAGGGWMYHSGCFFQQIHVLQRWPEQKATEQRQCWSCKNWIHRLPGRINFSEIPSCPTKEKNPFTGALGLLWYSTSMLDNISMLALELRILVFEELINIMDKPRVLLFLLIFWLNFYLGNVHVQEEWQLVGEVGRGRWSAWGLFSRNHSVTVHCVIRKTRKKAKWLWCGLAFFQLLT